MEIGERTVFSALSAGFQRSEADSTRDSTLISLDRAAQVSNLSALLR